MKNNNIQNIQNLIDLYFANLCKAIGEAELKEYFSIKFQISPADLMGTNGKETADSSSATKGDESATKANATPKAKRGTKRGTKRQAAKETARKVAYTTANTYDGTETDAEALIRIVSKHPEIRLRDESETYTAYKTGVLTCEAAAMWMIHKSADNGKLFSETLDVAIAAHLHENAKGLCAPTLLMIWRILTLHNYNHSKVKSALIDLLRKNTVNAITVLAKATEKYTQRNVHDQRVLYIEELLAEKPGIKNQMR